MLIFFLSQGIVGAANGQCNPLGDADFCVEDFAVVAENQELQEGDVVLLEVEVRNVGEEVADVRVVYSVEYPEGHEYTKLEDIKNLSPNETTTISGQARVESTGERSVNVMLLNSRDTHLYDSTGYQHSYQAVPSETSPFSWIWKAITRIEVLVSIAVGSLGIIYYLKNRKMRL
jgi:hypothetical protein